MRKIALGSLVAALVLVTGCGRAAAPAGAGPGKTCAPAQIAPAGASFVSAANGWLLGITTPDCTAAGSSRVVVRKTADGGRHWSPVPAPPAPWGGGPAVRRDAVTSILFADPRDGWAYGPGLWVTHDGGATWRQAGTGGRGVYSMAATDGHVVAAFLTCGTDCGRGTVSSFTVETTPAGSGTWRAVPGAAGTGEPVVTASAGTAYAAGFGANGSPSALLAGPADGSARWTRHTTPCPGAPNMAIAASAATAHGLVLACTVLGTHPAVTRLYRSGDSGAHWQGFGHIAMYDGPDVIEVTGGTVLAAGSYDGIAVSRDGGRTWQRPAAVDRLPQTEAGGPVLAAMTSDETGWAIAGPGPMWITADGGATWTPVTVR